jgi:sphingomyelin phosphodiesterase acid-like 3
MDYTVYEASNSSGIATTWAKEYAFKETYHESSFSGTSLTELIGRLRADPLASGEESRSYQTHFMKGSSGKKMSSSWPGYVCAMDNATSKTFKACVCGVK